MTTATFRNPPVHRGVVHFRTGRLVACCVVLMALAVGSGLWFLHAHGRRDTTPPVSSSSRPAWIKQAMTYPAEAQAATAPTEPSPEPNAVLLRQLSALQQQLAEQQAMLDDLTRRPATVIQHTPAPAATTASVKDRRPAGGMLFITHDLKDASSGPTTPAYTLAPGTTKLPCIVETVVNSDVPGYLTCKVSTNVYDTATGQHLLVPQGSTILGHDNSGDLIYGDTRLNTVSLTLALPDGRTLDLGNAPITDQAGVAGLTGDVNNHYLTLFGAVFIGGALKGGITAMQTAVTSAAGAGQIATGIGTLGSQATNRVMQPYINTRPTILVEAGQLAHVLLIKPLSLPAMWQGPAPITTTAHTSPSTRR